MLLLGTIAALNSRFPSEGPFLLLTIPSLWACEPSTIRHNCPTNGHITLDLSARTRSLLVLLLLHVDLKWVLHFFPPSFRFVLFPRDIESLSPSRYDGKGVCGKRGFRAMRTTVEILPIISGAIAREKRRISSWRCYRFDGRIMRWRECSQGFVGSLKIHHQFWGFLCPFLNSQCRKIKFNTENVLYLWKNILKNLNNHHSTPNLP